MVLKSQFELKARFQRAILCMSSDNRKFSNSRTFDLLAAFPLIAWYGFAVAGLLRSLRLVSAALHGPYWRLVLDVSSQSAMTMICYEEQILSATFASYRE